MNIKKKIASLIVAGAACTLPAAAQVGLPRNNFAIGVNGGMNFNSTTFSPTVQEGTLNGITGGLTARYISEIYFKLICGAQLEVNYSQQGWREAYEDYPTLDYQRKMDYVTIPFLAHVAYGKERGFQFFVHAGPQIGFLLNDSWTRSGDWKGTIDSGARLTTEQHEKAIDNTFDYGIAGGAGFELRTKAGCFLVEGRYYYALSDFYNSTKKDFFGRAAHNTITAKITYLFEIKK